MNGLTKGALLLMAVGIVAAAPTTTGRTVARSNFASAEVTVDADPASEFWAGAAIIYADSDPQGRKVPAYRTKVLSRWTNENLYFLFVCPYEELNLKPDPQTSTETNQLWNWDVAEVFIGSDFKNIKHYREFEVSPQGEWIDLDVDLNKPHHEEGWVWNSGFQVSARIDRARRVWYGAMRIPYSSIDSRPAKSGNVFRVNFFRSQGPRSHMQQIAWRAPMANSFHRPERFGLLKLVAQK